MWRELENEVRLVIGLGMEQLVSHHKDSSVETGKGRLENAMEVTPDPEKRPGETETWIPGLTHSPKK